VSSDHAVLVNSVTHTSQSGGQQKMAAMVSTEQLLSLLCLESSQCCTFTNWLVQCGSVASTSGTTSYLLTVLTRLLYFMKFIACFVLQNPNNSLLDAVCSFTVRIDWCQELGRLWHSGFVVGIIFFVCPACLFLVLLIIIMPYTITIHNPSTRRTSE